jgi:CHAT domain-containing protein
MRTILYTIFLTFLPGFIYCQRTDNISIEILTKANFYFESRKFDSALIAYKEFHVGNELSYSQKKTYIRNNLDNNLEAQVAMQIANIYALKEEYDSAETWYQTALSHANNWNSLKTKILQNIGSLYFFKEHYEKAILYYQKSWIFYLKEPIKVPERIVDLLISLGTAYSGNGDYQKSFSCFHQADSVLTMLKKIDAMRRAGLNINMSEVLVKLDAPSKALTQYRSACEFMSDGLNSTTTAQITANEGIAECYSRLGQRDSAMSHLVVCLRLMDSEGPNMKHERARVYLLMGDILTRFNEREKSMHYYHEAIASIISDSIEFKIEGIYTSNHEPDLLALYKIYEHMGRSQLESAYNADFDTICLAQSFSYFQKALKISDHIRKDFGQGSSRMTFYESTKSILAGALESGFQLKGKKNIVDFSDLFSMADTSRNRVLLEDMEENRFLSTSEFPDSVLTKIKRLKDEIVFDSRKYIKENSSPVGSNYPEIRQLQNKVIDLKLKLDSLRDNLDQYAPESNAQAMEDKRAWPSCIMKSLKNNEAMLEYFRSDSLIYIFLIRSERLFMHRVVLPASFDSTLRECLHQLKGAGTHNFYTLSRTMYNYLIAPIEHHLNGIHRLVIIPDEELSLFPFETLIREESSEISARNTSSWHYLVKDFEILYHFSVDAWYKDTANSKLLPMYYRFAGFAPGFKKNPDESVSMNPLPFTLNEVKGIADLFNHGSSHQPVFLDTSATEKNFRLYAPGYTHIHIATHSIISDGYPMNSALVFTQCDKFQSQQDKNDGLLHLDEINNLHLNASLVVLSACSTGAGQVTRTEGVLALTRGFYLAGASNVVYSLWNVPDHTTGEFMMNFYRYYFSRKSYSEALREVKLKMIACPETSLPYMWAGFVLLGRN